jgi:hypothetical protein
MTGQKVAVVGLLPYRQARTGGPPGIKNVVIRTSSGTDPLQKIENKRFNHRVRRVDKVTTRDLTTTERGDSALGRRLTTLEKMREVVATIP